MTEAKVDVYGNPINAEGTVVDKDVAPRVNSNEYKLVPGKTYTKDPIVSVTAGSEACWLFVKVQNDIFDIEGGTTIAGQITNNGWTLLQESNDKKESVYYRSVAADVAQAGDNFNVFGGFTIKGDVTGVTMTNYAGAKITVTAYAIQADGFTEVADAWSTLMSTYASTQP